MKYCRFACYPLVSSGSIESIVRAIRTRRNEIIAASRSHANVDTRGERPFGPIETSRSDTDGRLSEDLNNETSREDDEEKQMRRKNVILEKQSLESCVNFYIYSHYNLMLRFPPTSTN